MAPKDDTSTPSFNPKHAAFIKDVFANMTTKPDTDWDGVARAQKLKDSKCAKERFRQICKINGWTFGDANGGGDSQKSTPVKGRAGKKAAMRKAVKSEDADAEDGGDKMEEEEA